MDVGRILPAMSLDRLYRTWALPVGSPVTVSTPGEPAFETVLRATPFKLRRVPMVLVEGRDRPIPIEQVTLRGTPSDALMRVQHFRCYHLGWGGAGHVVELPGTTRCSGPCEQLDALARPPTFPTTTLVAALADHTHSVRWGAKYPCLVYVEDGCSAEWPAVIVETALERLARIEGKFRT